MNVAFISDVHSNVHALNEVFTSLEDLSVDEIFCCGDIVGYNAFPRECITILKDKQISSVMGNHDWATITGDASGFNAYGVAGVEYSRKSVDEEGIQFLKGLPEKRRFRRDNIIFYLAHGSPKDPIFEYVFPWSSDALFADYAKVVDADIIILGHTHIPLEKNVGDTVFLNPGSIGQPRDGDPRASFLVFNTKERTYQWHRVTYDIDNAAKAIREKHLPFFLAERLYVGR